MHLFSPCQYVHSRCMSASNKAMRYGDPAQIEGGFTAEVLTLFNFTNALVLVSGTIS